MTDNSILLLGAGELGLAVLEALAHHPLRPSASLSVLIRPSTLHSTDPAKQASLSHLRDLGASLVEGDVAADPESTLAETFSRFRTIVACTGFSLPAGTQLRLARAALAARVPRYFPWQFGVDYDAIGAGSAQALFDEQLAVRALLREADTAAAAAAAAAEGGQPSVEWTVVSTGIFTSFLFEPAFGVVDLGQRVVRALGSWKNEITLTTPADIGRATAELLLDPRGEKGVVFVAGDTISYGRVADLVEARFGGSGFKREVWTVPFLESELEKNPGDKMKMYCGVFAAGVGISWPVEKTLNHRRGIKTTDVETYLRTSDQFASVASA